MRIAPINFGSGPSLWRRLLCAAVAGALALQAPAAAQVSSAAASQPAGVDLSGVWMKPPRDVADPGLSVPAIPPAPLKAPHKQAYDALRKRMAEAEARGEPMDFDRANCLPDGMPKLMASTLPIEILQEPDKIIIIVEFGTQVRHIYLGDATHPPEDELEFNFFGSSVGRWDGNVLVVETIGVQKSTTLFDYVPHGEKLRIVERFRLASPNLLEVEMTITDPEYLDGNWVVHRKYSRRSDLKLREFVCQENNRSARTSD